MIVIHSIGTKISRAAALVLVVLMICWNGPAFAEFQLEVPAIVHSGQDFGIVIKAENVTSEMSSQPLFLQLGSGPALPIELSGFSTTVTGLRSVDRGTTNIKLTAEDTALASATVRVIPGWMSIIPPLIAIGLALWLKSVIPAIFFGLWAGLVVQYGFSVSNFFKAFMDIFSVNIVNALDQRDHISLLLFTAMIGGMVGVVSRNGGMNGVVNIMVRWANSRKRGQLSVFFLGLVIFFDDYTNTLVVGNAVRPITDKLKISREKLAYIVDSTAAPVAAIAVITTWIGYELGLIADIVQAIDGFDEPAYTIFLNSIPYSFYPLLTIFFVYLVASSGRDFGPMLAAEQRSLAATGIIARDAQQQAGIDMADGLPARAINAIAPIAVLIGGSVIGLFVTGEGDNLQQIFSSADVYLALMWGSFLSAAVAGGLTLSQRLLSMEETVQAWLQGANVMLPPLVILVLAWALSSVTSVMGTADFLVSLGGDVLVPAFIPAIAFILSAAAAFATGSSWGVMAIILPLVVPVAWSSLVADGGVTPDNMHIIYSTVSCVLAGSVWGDHCSPISDTTVLSSLASGCNHIEHVRTQMPYALLVGAVSLLGGIIPVGLGVPWWMAQPVCGVVLVIILRLVGKSADS